MEEIWKDIKGYEGLYQISNLGRVKSLISSTPDKEKFISIINGKKNGYCYAMLHKSGRNKNYLLHRLIAENFIPNIENKPNINHIDGNPLNNNIDNLEIKLLGEHQRQHSVKYYDKEAKRTY